MKFNYQFQRLLDWQYDLENQSKTRISNLIKERVQLEQLIAQKEAEQKAFFEKLKASPDRVHWSPFERGEAERYRGYRKKVVELLEQNSGNLESEKLVLRKLIQKRQLLEEIRTKKQKEFRLAVSKKEQKQLDDLANRFAEKNE